MVVSKIRSEVQYGSYFFPDFFHEAIIFARSLGHSIFPPHSSQCLAERKISRLQFSQKNRCCFLSVSVAVIATHNVEIEFTPYFDLQRFDLNLGDVVVSV